MMINARTPVLGLPMIVRRPPPQLILIGHGEFEAHEILRTAGPAVRSAVGATAGYFGVEPWQLLLRRRFCRFVKPRQVAMAVVKSRAGMATSDIGRRFGGYDHSTVSRAIRVADRSAVAAVSALLDEVRG